MDFDKPIFNANIDIAICVGFDDNTEYNNAPYSNLLIINKSLMYLFSKTSRTFRQTRLGYLPKYFKQFTNTNSKQLVCRHLFDISVLVEKINGCLENLFVDFGNWFEQLREYLYR